MRRRQPEGIDESIEIPRWVRRLWPEDVDRFAGPDNGPDAETIEAHKWQQGTQQSLEAYWAFVRYVRARRAWREASDGWWRENAPMHPKAPAQIRREMSAR